MKKTPETDKHSFIPVVLIALLAVVLGIIAQQLLFDRKSSAANPELQTITWLTPGKPIQPFTLTDHRGEAFSIDRFRGHWSIVFFGFTNCPDICPTTMQMLKTVKQAVIDEGAWRDTQVIFMSVDPKRDDAAQLARYVPFFDPEFVGLTGDESQVQSFAKQMSMPFIIEPADDRGNYNVAHSASLLLIGPEATLRGIASAPHDHQLLSADLITLHKTLGSAK